MKKNSFSFMFSKVAEDWEYAAHKFIKPICSQFYFAHATGNIAIISNCHAIVGRFVLTCKS